MSHTIVKRSDPITSYIAAREITESGARAALKAAVYEYVARYPGLTAGELAAHMYFDGALPESDRVMVARRLSDLKNDGEIHQGDARKCTVANRLCMTWYVGPAEPEQGELPW